jgi:hypothetical protein
MAVRRSVTFTCRHPSSGANIMNRLAVIDAPIQAFAAQHTNLGLYHIQPAWCRIAVGSPGLQAGERRRLRPTWHLSRCVQRRQVAAKVTVISM